MKYLFLGILLAAIVVPWFVSAYQEPVECCKIVRKVELSAGESYDAGTSVGAPGGTCPASIKQATHTETDKWGIICFLNAINAVINWIFAALMILVVLLAMLGAYYLMTAGGNAENVTKGRNYLMYAAIGLVVALIARAVPSIVKVVFG